MSLRHHYDLSGLPIRNWLTAGGNRDLVHVGVGVDVVQVDDSTR